MIALNRRKRRGRTGLPFLPLGGTAVHEDNRKRLKRRKESGVNSILVLDLVPKFIYIIQG
jgi:hypothetical protein